MSNYRVRCTGTLAVVLGNVLLTSSYALASDADRVIVENGDFVRIEDRLVETTGEQVHGFQVVAFGQLLARNIQAITQGDGARGISVGTSGHAHLRQLSVQTHGDSAAGAYVFSNARASFLGGTISTSGDSSHGLLAMSGSKAKARDLVISTLGENSSGVQAGVLSQIELSKLSVTTRGAGAVGLQVSNNALIEANQVQVTTHGDNAIGAKAIVFDSVLRLFDSEVGTYGTGSHGLSSQGNGSQGSGADPVPTPLIEAHRSLVRTHGAQAAGIDISRGGRVMLNDTVVEAVGEGASAVRMNGGELTVHGGSLMAQLAEAFSIQGEHNRIMIDGAAVTSATTAVFKLKEQAQADIWVGKGSVLTAAGGQGNLLDLGDGSRLNLIVDNSVINANLIVADGQDVNVELRNGTRLNGRASGVGTLQLDAEGHWQVSGDSQLKHLKLDGGAVSFGDAGQFQRLSMGTLEGNGVFTLRMDMNARTTDFLQIDGDAQGRHLLRIRNSGVEPEANFDPLQVVGTGGGDAQFVLLDGRVDLGAFSYQLQQDGNDWYVASKATTVSPSTATVKALSNTAPTIWYGEMTTLRSRMGEVRASGHGGAWMRSYGNKFNVDGDGGGYRQRQTGFSLGSDTVVKQETGRLAIGVLAGYSHSSLDLSRGSRGKVQSYYMGAYGTWLDDSGYYLDASIKLNRFQNQADVSMSDAQRAEGAASTYGLGSTLEAGRHIELNNDLYVEPFAQIAGLVVSGSRLTLDNGLNARSSATRSLVTKAGTTFGQTHALKGGGIVQPYLKVAVAQEFARKNDIKVNGHRFRNDLHGTRGEWGAGVAVSMSQNLQLHGHVDYMNGQQIEQPFGVNVGLRYAFD